MPTATGTYATAAELMVTIGGSQVFTSDQEALMARICDRVNQYVETVTRQPIAPIDSGTYLYDGNGLRRIFLPSPTNASTIGIGGARTISLVEIAPYTGADFVTIASTDYFPRQRTSIDGPYRWLLLSDYPAGSYSVWTQPSSFVYPVGIANVRVTMTAGWDAIPDDLIDVALAVAHRAWNARESGYQNVDGIDEQGRPVVARFLGGKDREILMRYKLRPPV